MLQQEFVVKTEVSSSYKAVKPNLSIVCIDGLISTVLITKGIEEGEVYFNKFLVRPFLSQKSHLKNASKLNAKNLVKSSGMLLKL